MTTNGQGWPRDRYPVLERLRDAINAEYGFVSGWPRINLGPCGSFAKLFREAWMRRIDDHVRIVFVMDTKWCRHICVRFPHGVFYDGGFGVMTDSDIHRKFAKVGPVTLETMDTYDEQRLERWSYGWTNQYHLCPNYSWTTTQRIIDEHLLLLSSANRPSPG